MMLGLWAKEEHVDLHLLSSLLPNTDTSQFPYHSAYLTFQISVSHVFLYVSQCKFWELLELQYKPSPKIHLKSTLMWFEGPSLGSDLFNGRELEIKQHVCNIRAANLTIHLFSWVGTKEAQSTETNIKNLVTGGKKCGYIPDFITPRTDHLFHTRLWVTQLQCVLYYCTTTASTVPTHCSVGVYRFSFQCGHLTGSVGTLNLEDFHTGTTICRI